MAACTVETLRVGDETMTVMRATYAKVEEGYCSSCHEQFLQMIDARPGMYCVYTCSFRCLSCGKVLEVGLLEHQIETYDRIQDKLEADLDHDRDLLDFRNDAEIISACIRDGMILPIDF